MGQNILTKGVMGFLVLQTILQSMGNTHIDIHTHTYMYTYTTYTDIQIEKYTYTY